MRKYMITALFLLLLLGSVVIFLCPADTESILAENREPQQMPEFSMGAVASGEYMAQIDEYINDNVGFRSKLMNISDKIQSCFGFLPGDMGKVITTTSDIGTGVSQDSRLVIYDGKIMEMFKKNPEAEQRYADALNSIRNNIPDTVAMYSMLIPTQLEFCEPFYASAEDSQYDAIASVDSKLININTVDAYGKLAAASMTGDGYLYFNTDHHWTMDGAFCGYEAFAETTGALKYEKEWFMKKTMPEPFYGSLYLKAKSQLLHDTNDTMSYYDVAEAGNYTMTMRAEDGITVYGTQSPVFNTENNNYNIFFGGDQPLMEINNNNLPDGKTIVIIKDSYANALLPWLMNNYKTMVVIDPRSFGGNLLDEIQRYNADEVAVINYVFTTTFGDYCSMIEKLMTN